jgi:hypothetical protein
MANGANVHFLHIGKCAGTTIKALIEQINVRAGAQLILAHPHTVRLADLPAGAPYFFSVRDPVSRFYSAFYSRKRRGQPRIYSEWTQGERKAFGRFAQATELAESLFTGSAVGRSAASAMATIGHVRQHQHSWFDNAERLFEDLPPLCILRQEHLAADVDGLITALGLEGEFDLETDPVKAHRNDYSQAAPLSDLAIANLKRWYAADIQFNALATAWIEERTSAVVL